VLQGAGFVLGKDDNLSCSLREALEQPSASFPSDSGTYRTEPVRRL
jgi:hypothetical protein